MDYISSRGQASGISAAEAIIKGIAPDGGLFVPEYIPRLTEDIFSVMEGWNYQERARHILACYLLDFTESEIKQCVEGAYNSKNFNDERIAPLVKLGDNKYILELWHGPTCAFKRYICRYCPI